LKKEDYIDSIPLVILLGMASYTIFQVTTTSYTIGWPQYIGFTLLGISIILFFQNRRFYKYFLGLTLFLGLLGLVTFSLSISTISIMGLLPIQYSIIPICFVFYLVNKDKILSKLGDYKNENPSQIIVEKKSKINGFKRKFRSLSDQEIKDKLKQPLVPEAIIALRQLQAERMVA